MNMLKMLGAALAIAVSTSACAAGGMIDVGVYDRALGARLAVHWHQGRAYLAGTPGHEYQLLLHNRSAEPLLAVVSVDGVNVVTGETANPSQGGYVVPAGRSVEILGWRKSLSHTAAFYFTDLGDSYAARTGRPDNVGVIGVALFRQKVRPPAQLGRAEAPAAERRADAAPGSLGTGHGRHEESQAYYVPFERASSVPAETVTLYYDSRVNLVARGVLEEPRPFPGFVPDPPGVTLPWHGGHG
ncbi:MAG TPA: hypothetical protein VEH51_00655 [Burkholderiales bacterium]|nr:hypothetical protein [Burkholderiales bacterium]